MTLRTTLAVIIMIALAHSATAQWTAEQPITAAPFDGGYSFVIGGKIYVGAEDALYAYDPVAGTWQSRAVFTGEGTGRAWATAFVIGATAYVGLGITDGNIFRTDLRAYDPVSNAWSPKASFPGTARGGASAFVVNGKAYICGGTSTGPTFSDVYSYDPVADAWALVSALPTGTRGFTTAFAIGNYGYVYGGYVGFGNETPQVHRYDPVANTWAQMASFPGGGRQSAVGVVVNGKAIVGMGHQGFTTGFTNFYLYDPLSNVWTSTCTSFPGGTRVSPVAAAIGNMVYLGTGNDLTTFTPNNDWWSNTCGLVGVGENNELANSMLIHPIPTSDAVTITLNSPDAGTISIMDISGSVVLTKSVFGGTVRMDLSSLGAGLYTARFATEDGTIVNSRIIKQ